MVPGCTLIVLFGALVVVVLWVVGVVGDRVVCLVEYPAVGFIGELTGFQGLYKDCVTDSSVVVI